MSNKIEVIEEIKLSSTEDGKIEVATLAQPYGENSESVASIGIFLNSNNQEPQWKVHIPKNNLDAVIEALQKAKAKL